MVPRAAIPEGMATCTTACSSVVCFVRGATERRVKKHAYRIESGEKKLVNCGRCTSCPVQLDSDIVIQDRGYLLCASA